MAKFEVTEYVYYNKEKTKGCHLRISIDYEIEETPGFEPNKIKLISKSFVVSDKFQKEEWGGYHVDYTYDNYCHKASEAARRMNQYLGEKGRFTYKHINEHIESMVYCLRWREVKRARKARFESFTTGMAKLLKDHGYSIEAYESYDNYDNPQDSFEIKDETGHTEYLSDIFDTVISKFNDMKN